MDPLAAYGGPVPGSLAGFGQRVGAFILDMFIVTVTLGITSGIATATGEENYYGESEPSGLGVLLSFVVWVAALLYPVFFEGRTAGQTIGKRAVGIRVVRLADGRPLGYAHALGRLVARIADIFGIGLVWALWDPKHQTFHDKIASTLVVRAGVYPPGPWPGSGSWSSPTPQPGPGLQPPRF